MGFVRADGGRATLGGRPCFADRAAIQREVGYLPGELALPGDMTGRSFLAFVAGMRGTALPCRANALIDYFELDPSAKLRAMSKGTRQKVGIVAAFMHGPAVLLLDEPTSGLDLLMQRRFVELVRAEKRRGATILLSSHVLGEVEGTCDRALFVRSGRLTSEACAADLTLDATLEHLYGAEALRRRCDEVGALLVFDEIQTGMGRTGAMFAMQKYGVVPDIVCLAKAFGGGMPLGAFVARHEIMDTLQTDPVLGHITTFGGHPVCCAAGLAALDYLLEHRVVEEAERKGALYEELLGDHPAVRGIRRAGLLLAVELGSSEPLYRIMELFKEAGIMSDWFLYCDTAFRISPPLTISDDEIRDSAALIRRCLDELK